MNIRIRESVEKLIDSIQTSSEYQTYLSCEEALMQYPGMLDRILDLRRKTIETYNDPDKSDLVGVSEQLLAEYEELERIPAVNAYLEAEEEVVRILREVSRAVTGNVRLKMPELHDDMIMMQN